jgi:hypothetical protein
VAQQHRQELADIEPIGLRSALAPIDLNAGGIDDVILDPMRYSVTVQPEPIAASLITAHDARLLGQAKALLCPCALLLSPFDRTSRDHPFASLLGHTNGKAEFPWVLPQFKRQLQRRPRKAILLNATRCGCGHRLTPSCEYGF